MSGLLQAQSISVVNNKNTFHGVINKELRVPIEIKNNSDHPVYVFVRRVGNKIGSTQSTNFCLGELCFDKVIDKLPVSHKIEPGVTSSAFVSILQTGLMSGFSTVKYEIYTRGNPNQIIEYEITYVVEDNVKITTLFASDDIVLNELYPNPVKEFAIVDYRINNPELEAKIIIHNVLGSVVGEFDLPVLEKELKIPVKDYNPGVYFYTLYLDGDGAITKKLVIRR